MSVISQFSHPLHRQLCQHMRHHARVRGGCAVVNIDTVCLCGSTAEAKMLTVDTAFTERPCHGFLLVVTLQSTPPKGVTYLTCSCLDFPSQVDGVPNKGNP